MLIFFFVLADVKLVILSTLLFLAQNSFDLFQFIFIKLYNEDDASLIRNLGLALV